MPFLIYNHTMTALGLTRILIRATIPDLYRTYKTASAALRWLRKEGYGYRRQDFLADWREITGMKKKEAVWKYIRKSYKPSIDMFETTAMELTGEYQYIGKLYYLDSTGAYAEKTMSFLTDELISISDAEGIMSNMADNAVTRYGINTILSVLVTAGRRRE